MNIFGKDLGRDFVLIAEIGVNHEGSFEKAKELVTLAHRAGADAVKLQSYTPDRYVSRSNPERFARVSKFALSREHHAELFAHAREIGCTLFSTPLTEDWVETLNSSVSAFKIASGDLTFEPVVRACARTGKKTLISTGASTLEEVKTAVRWFEEEVGSENLRDRLALLHCVSAYPVPIEQSNLNSIPYLREKTGLEIGFSNHVIGPEACVIAASLGASIFEVHFTDRREGKTFHDHHLSMEPEELARLRETIGRVRAALGHFEKKVMDCEKPILPLMRKGLIAWRDIETGQVIGREDVAYARPATEFSSRDMKAIIGKRTKKPFTKGELIDASSLG